MSADALHASGLAGFLWTWLIGPLTEFGFMRRALVGCVALSLGCAPVGVFLLLRRMSLTGDAMAHAILPGAALGYLIAGLSLPAMTAGGVVAGLLVAVGSGLVARSTVLREDASLAAFYLLSLALGVLIVSTRGSSVDLMHVLFGTVLALGDAALALLVSIAMATMAALALLYRPLLLECLDAQFLRSVSRLSALAHYGFLVLVVINLVAGFHALGTLMAVGIMVLPAATARLWVRSVPALMAMSAALALAASVAGLLVSYHADWPTSPSIVLCLGVVYLASLITGRHGAFSHRWQGRRHRSA
ncbi:MAG: metal ABC transporter permease [Pseudomonadota bacterium]|nr:metal ABC transporter permease [Pseudomonadota bacterium]